jgi:hypothetical protein
MTKSTANAPLNIWNVAPLFETVFAPVFVMGISKRAPVDE